jgi:hypothetical protein
MTGLMLSAADGCGQHTNYKALFNGVLGWARLN